MSVIRDETWRRDYTALMRCDAGDHWMPDVEAQVSSWLHGKQVDLDLSKDADYETSGRRVSVRRIESGQGLEFKLSMVEETPAGVWTTELLAHDEPSGDDWIYLAVDNDEGRFVAVPRLARYLMQVLPLGDGTIEFTDAPHRYGRHDIDGLVETLADRDRHGLVFVAGTSDEDQIPVEAFARKVHDWTKQVFGLAQVVILDPSATVAFEEQVGARFRVPAWTIRTYQPGVQFTDGADARRHRILGTDRLSSLADRRIAQLLGDIARRQAAERELPASVQRLRRRFDRIENRRLVEALEIVPAIPEEAPVVVAKPAAATETTSDGLREHVAQLVLVRQILGLKEITESVLHDIAARISSGGLERNRVVELGRRVESLQSRAEQLEDDNRLLRTAVDEEQMATQVALLDVDDRDSRIRWLEARLKERGDFEAQYLPVPSEFLAERPSDFEELLERIDRTTGVVFTGDPDDVARLNAVDTNDGALRAAWEALLTLSGYVRARACGDWDESLDKFINHTPTGYAAIAPGKWAHTETATTMKSFGNERMFPVPKEVDVSEQAEMKAHFKLARIGMVSPRMHILDAHPKEPVVYIGYIGAHLTNTHT